jgi:1A family penicillin-binding protein
MSFANRTLSPQNWKGYSRPGKTKSLVSKIINLLISIIERGASFLGSLFLFSKNMARRTYSGYRTSSIRGYKKMVFQKIAAYGSLTILLAVIFLSVFSVAALAWFSRDLPSPNRLLEREVAQSTKIFDRTGKTILYEIYSEKKRTLVELSNIPDFVKQATLVAEDRDFYKHHGFDLKGILRSVWRNITRGQRVGGSTITQQFIKNAILSPEKTYTRKLKEFALSIQLERKFSKDEILKMYFNEIPYGSTSYGIQSAAQTFFGKDVRDLDLAEGALLAALPQAPTRYSPSGNNTDALLNRQKWILDSMVSEGYISEEESSRAKEIDVLSKIVPKRESIIAPHFIMYVKEILTEKYGEKMVEQGGLKVYTTIDVEKQKFAEEAIAENEEKNETKYNATNAALISLDPKTGEILAMVGSKDYFNVEIDGNVNVVLRPRQPGSSFKPIAYAAAFQKGFTPETILFDLETAFKTDTKNYAPKNYDGKERGPISMKQALAGSLNIPAVKTLYLAGYNYVLDLAEKLGYTTFKNRSQFGLSLVLGGGEIKLLEHANAFAVFAAEGKFHKNVAILKVEGTNGNILDEWKAEEGEQVLDIQTTRQISSILSDDNARSFIFGAGSPLTLPGRPVAAKTGTTNDWNDGWTMGYTPSLVAGVWVGNNNDKEMKRGADGVLVAAPIWNSYMKKALKDTPPEAFIPPEPTVSDKPILNGELGPETIVKLDRATGKLATEFTPQTFIEEKKLREVHTILFYVDKNNPKGPPPENPESDPQFSAWEAPIQQWAEKNGYTLAQLPTEYDDIHTLQNKPSIALVSPLNNATVDSREVSAQVIVSAPRGISRVEYFIDDKLIKTSRSYPFNLFGNIPNAIPNGFHILRAVAYDDVDNNNAVEININLLAPKISPTLSFIDPRDNSMFYATGFPLPIKASISDASNIVEVVFFSRDSSGNISIINTASSPSGSEFNFVWQTALPPGAYFIYAEIQDSDGQKYKSGEIKVNVL